MQRSTPLPQAHAPFAPSERWRSTIDRTRLRLADPVERPALLWRALWSPYWVWSDVPPAELPRRESRPPAALGLAGEAVLQGIDRIRRRLWFNHAAAALCRGLWIGLLLAAALMLLDVAGGPVFDPRVAAVLGGLAVAGGLVLALASKPSRLRAARMLDRTFGLHERLTTALGDLGLGVPTAGERPPVVYLQMADAANAVAALRRNPRLRPAIPVREVVLVVLTGLILTTLAFVRGLGGSLPDLASAHVPPFTPAIERPPAPTPSAAEIQAAASPTVQEVLQRADQSTQARHDLQTLAKALADHAETRQAAESITKGDYATARNRLQEAGDQSGNLSPGERTSLSRDLQQAADAMRPQTNGLNEATSKAASGLSKDDDAARAGMRGLADAVEQAGKQVVPQDQLASQMRGAQQSQAPGSQGQPASAQPASQTNNAATRYSDSGDPGSGAEAQTAPSGNASDQRGGEESANGSDPGQSARGQERGAGQPGQSNSPGQGGREGTGQNGAPGNASRTSAAANGAPGEQQSASAQQGAGAGAGHDANASPGQPSSAAAKTQPAPGEAPAPNATSGGSAEADPQAPPAARDTIALPAGEGDQGVQTSADGGSALQGSGAGVTAGSGYAEQGEVGKAGPDSNRVPPEHRETVENYFSNGGGG